MFLDNKYTRWYFKIIDGAWKMPYARTKRAVSGIYTERHHIVPRALGGGDDPDNIVRLTGRAHFVCHRLLTKMTSGTEKSLMIMAVHFMTLSGRYKLSSIVYERARKEFGVVISQHNKGKPKPPWSPEHLANVQKANKARTGTKATLETRVKMSVSHKGKKLPRWSTEARANLSRVRTGKKMAPFTLEHRANMGKAQRGKPKFPQRDIKILTMFDAGYNKHDIAAAVGVSTKVVLETNRKRKRGFYTQLYSPLSLVPSLEGLERVIERKQNDPEVDPHISMVDVMELASSPPPSEH